MKPDIFPQSLEVLPNDSQLFTLRATFPPAVWKVIEQPGNGGVIEPDYSILQGRAGLSPLGEGLYQLVSGIGSIEYTLDNQCIPASANEFILYAQLRKPPSSVWSISIRVRQTDIRINYEGVINAAILAITPAVGMRI